MIFEVGRVYVVPTRTLANHNKIVICCIEPDRFIWINTQPNRRRPEAQVQIAENEHTALTHDSYIDLSRITTFPPHELDAAEARDMISPAVAQRIIAGLADVVTLTPGQIQSISDALSRIV